MIVVKLQGIRILFHKILEFITYYNNLNVIEFIHVLSPTLCMTFSHLLKQLIVMMMKYTVFLILHLSVMSAQ